MEYIEAGQRVSMEMLEKTLATIEIPTCPAMVTKVMAEAQKEIPDINVLARMIAADVGMAASTLKLANSPIFGARGGVRTVSQAVSRLGTRNIVCVVVTVALKESMKGVPSAFLEHFWSRAANVAVAAGVIAGRVYRVAPDEAQSYGLFHDAAIPVLMRRYPNYSEVLASAANQGIPPGTAEMAAFNCNHAIVGALLARNWGLSPVLAQAIRFHHEPKLYSLPADTLSPEALSLIAVTQVAEYLDSEVRGGQIDSELEANLGPALKYLGISSSDLSDVQEDLAEALNEVGR